MRSVCHIDERLGCVNVLGRTVLNTDRLVTWFVPVMGEITLPAGRFLG